MAMQGHSNPLIQCRLPHPVPLVSLIILTCNRHKFLKLALASAEAQTYPNIEAIVVDDGSRRVPASITSGTRLPVKLVRLKARASIGRKRNAGFQAARGRVILHWDDDDMHSPNHVFSLACPILNNMTELAALTFSYLARLSSTGVAFYAWGKGRGSGGTTGAFLGTLAYSRAVAASLSLRADAQQLQPFPHASLSEDVHLVERALGACHRFLPVRGVPVVYTRHASVTNTWRPEGLEGRMNKPPIKPPLFVSARLRDAYMTAEREASELGACSALKRQPAKGLTQPLHFPFMPMRCCEGRKKAMRKPCQDLMHDCGDSYCGASKGTCTASCTCPGEAAHGAGTTRPCGDYCCRYWHSFWRANAATNCSTRSQRPLKRHYCDGERGTGGHNQGSSVMRTRGAKHVAIVYGGHTALPSR